MGPFSHHSELADSTATAMPWAIKLPLEAVQQAIEVAANWSADCQTLDGRCLELLGRLRLNRQIVTCVDQQSLWIRGDVLDDQVSQTLRMFPECERFLVLADGQLVGWNETVPRRRLPERPWQLLSQWLLVELPVAAFTGQVDQKVPLQLVRTDVPVEANLLRTQWRIWCDYAADAPQIRLNSLSFAASANAEVLILGTPLPPLPGQRLVEAEGVAIPAGFRIEPSLGPDSLRMLLGYLPSEFVLFREDGSAEIVPKAAFVRATRSAVRLTDASFNHSAVEISTTSPGNEDSVNHA